jgi:hypothetical protein
VLPEVGVIESQLLPPVTVVLDTDQSMTPLPLLRIPKVCGGTIPPFATAVNVRPVWERRIVCCTALTVTVTGIVAVAADVVIVIWPV